MVKAIPEGLQTVTAQLSVDGAAEAIELYKKAFGAVEVARAPDPSGKKIWHASIQIGSSQVFVNDVFPEMGGKPSHTQFWIYGEGVDDRFKRAVDAGLKVRMPLADMFWGDRIGTVTDRWGNEWSLGQHMRDVTPEEMRKATENFGKKP